MPRQLSVRRETETDGAHGGALSCCRGGVVMTGVTLVVKSEIKSHRLVKEVTRTTVATAEYNG